MADGADGTGSVSPARLLFVHAHPDDETIVTGGTMARAVAEGARVTLVTCTRGELGEVIPPELAGLAADATEAERAASGRDGAALAAHREAELAEAMAVLGVSDHRFLGDVGPGAGLPPRRFRDSGMVWGDSGQAEAPAEMHPEAFCRADAAEAAAYLEAVIREVRPHVVVGYNDRGGYGHPDHVRAGEITLAAVERAAQPDSAGAGWRVEKVYRIETPESVARGEFDPTQPGFAETGFDAAGNLPIVPVPDAEVTTAVDVEPWLGAKALALSKHATQVMVAGEFMALSNRVGFRISDIEYFALARGEAGPDRDAEGRETSLSSGLRPGEDLSPSEPALAGAGGVSPVPSRPLGKRAWFRYTLAVVLGLIVGAFGTVAHQMYFMAGSTQLPVGLVIGGLLAVTGSLWLGLWAKDTGPLAVFSLVTVLEVWFFAFAKSPGGSVLIPGNARGIAWLFIPILVAAVMIFLVPRLVRGADGDAVGKNPAR